MTKVDKTLEERGNRYGSFKGHAEITQGIKMLMRSVDGWDRLNDSQSEALEMIAHKIARILNGDPNYADNWHDIAGYATLVDEQLSKTRREPLRADSGLGHKVEIDKMRSEMMACVSLED